MATTPPRTRHFALLFILRGMGFLLALSSAFLTVIFLAVAITTTIFHHLSWEGVVLGIFLSLLMALFCGLIAVVGFNAWRKIDDTAVENLSFIFALLTARDFYYVGTAIWNLVASTPLAALHESVHVDYMWALAFLSFFIFRRIYIAALRKALNMGPSDDKGSPPAETPGGDDPTIPEFPARSPLISL